MTALIDPFPPRRYLRHGMLPQLAAFEAVVRMGSVTHAAESLCIAQPTLSGHLRKLAEALGIRLFEMHGKRLVPTDAALVLLQGVREVFAALERCERVLVNLRSPSRTAGQQPCVSEETGGPTVGHFRRLVMATTHHPLSAMPEAK